MPNILQKKLNYQRLANKMNQCNGIELIEIIDEQNEFADVYFNSSKLILRASYPIYDSKPYTNDFEDAVKWIFKILEGKISNEWVLALSDCGYWCVHVKVLDLKKAMKDLWWDENAALTLLDVNNNLILAIEVWESNIEVRILYLSSENAPAWVNRFACGKASLQHFEYTNIQRCEAQATISQVLEFESKSGLNLPTSYANFVLQYDGVNVLIHAFDSSNSSEKVNVNKHPHYIVQ